MKFASWEVICLAVEHMEKSFSVSEVVSNTFTYWLKNISIYGLFGFIYCIITSPIGSVMSSALVDFYRTTHIPIKTNLVGSFLYYYYALQSGILDSTIFITILLGSLVNLIILAYFTAVIIQATLSYYQNGTINLIETFKVPIKVLINVFLIELVLEVVFVEAILELPFSYIYLNVPVMIYAGDLIPALIIITLYIIAAIIVLYLLVKLYVSYAATVDGNSLIDSLKQSWNYIKGHWLAVFLILLIIQVILYIPNYGFRLLANYFISINLSIAVTVTILVQYVLLFSIPIIPVGLVYLKLKENST